MVSPWIEIQPRRPAAKARVFCVPYAGGTAQVFRSLALRLPESIEVGRIQPPGRWNRRKEPLLTRVDTTAEALVAELAPLLAEPYVLFGYSLGGLIAFEVARLLAGTGHPQPKALIVAARRAPAMEQTLPPLHGLPDREFIQAMQARYPGGIPNSVLEEPELLELLLPVLRADIQMFETYEYTPGDRLGCPIYALAGELDLVNPRSSMQGWQQETAAEFRVETLPGGHFFVDGSLDRVSAIIQAALAE